VRVPLVLAALAVCSYLDIGGERGSEAIAKKQE
jgi:hypothetical protein